MKHEFRGHCQGCGRIQAVMARGVLAKHGYEVKWNYFMGVCGGAGFKPLEVDRVECDLWIKGMRVAAESLAQDVALIDEGKLKPKLASSGRMVLVESPMRGKRYEPEMVPFYQAPDYKQEEAVRILRANLNNRSKGLYQNADSLEKLAAAVHGQPLIPAEQKEAPAKIEVGMEIVVPVHGKIKVAKLLYGYNAYSNAKWASCEVPGSERNMRFSIIELRKALRAA